MSGVKAVLERVGMFGPATIAAWTKIEAEHFGGAGMGAMMKALGVRGPTGPLGRRRRFLLNPFWMYAQFLIGLGAIIGCGRGSDFPALFTATSMTLFASTLLAGSAHGTKDALVRNAMAFEYAVALLHVCTTSLARKRFAPKQITAIRKCAAAVPLLMMAFLKMQGASFAKFAAAGMSGPGVLGPSPVCSSTRFTARSLSSSPSRTSVASPPEEPLSTVSASTSSSSSPSPRSSSPRGIAC